MLRACTSGFTDDIMFFQSIWRAYATVAASLYSRACYHPYTTWYWLRPVYMSAESRLDMSFVQGVSERSMWCAIFSSYVARPRHLCSVTEGRSPMFPVVLKVYVSVPTSVDMIALSATVIAMKLF